MNTLPRPVSYDGERVILLDQRKLPGEERYLAVQTPEEMFEAIATLTVRGAPAIGIAAGYGLCAAMKPWRKESGQAFLNRLEETARRLNAARPTAVNLGFAIRRVCAEAAGAVRQGREPYPAMETEARAIEAREEESCRSIGERFLSFLTPGMSILTHCNAGALATIRYGTALAPILLGAERGIAFHVYADETRPLLQGARLTAWELDRAGVEVTLLTDGMSASLMAQGKIGCVIVGCDRVAANGDFANKIGTYSVAVSARYHKVPFYVAAPCSTIDPRTPSGADIPIEMRGGEEVRSFGGRLVAPAGVEAYNPAFDVTPGGLATAIVTDRGVAEPPYGEKLVQLWKEASQCI